MLMVMPRWRSSGALSIWSNADAWFRVGYLSASTFVMAAVRVVLPWSTWPIVPMLTCGLLRSNFAFATAGPPQDCDDPPRDPVLRSSGVRGWIWSWPMDGQHPWWTSLWLMHRAFRCGPAHAEPCGEYGSIPTGTNPYPPADYSPFCFAMMVFAT